MSNWILKKKKKSRERNKNIMLHCTGTNLELEKTKIDLKKKTDNVNDLSTKLLGIPSSYWNIFKNNTKAKPLKNY